MHLSERFHMWAIFICYSFFALNSFYCLIGSSLCHFPVALKRLLGFYWLVYSEINTCCEIWYHFDWACFHQKYSQILSQSNSYANFLPKLQNSILMTALNDRPVSLHNYICELGQLYSDHPQNSWFPSKGKSLQLIIAKN